MSSLRVRPPAVAGLFYPGQPHQLKSIVDSMLEAEAPLEAPSPRRPKALVVPHAGYAYSGPIAASAYRLLRRADPPFRRVILFGPAHRAFVRGMALSGVDAFDTPLGPMTVDEDGTRALAALGEVVSIRPDAHEKEHSLEVQIPFLLRVARNATVLPVAVGRAETADVARALRAVWGGPETLVVISTDLSHFLAYDEARRVDRATIDRILREDAPEVDHEQACGATPLNGFLRVAREHGLASELLDLRTSGDTAGNKGEVVGYAALAYYDSRATA